DGGQPEVLQPCRGTLGERLSKFDQRRAAPEVKCPARSFDRARCVAGCEALPGFGRELLEPIDVELVCGDSQFVARAGGSSPQSSSISFSVGTTRLRWRRSRASNALGFAAARLTGFPSIRA